MPVETSLRSKVTWRPWCLTSGPRCIRLTMSLSWQRAREICCQKRPWYRLAYQVTYWMLFDILGLTEGSFEELKVERPYRLFFNFLVCDGFSRCVDNRTNSCLAIGYATVRSVQEPILEPIFQGTSPGAKAILRGTSQAPEIQTD